MSMMRSQNRSNQVLKAYSQHSSGKTAISSENRDEIFQQFRPRILHIARRIGERLPIGSSLSVEDLVSNGVIGLLEAIDRYDPSRNIQFSTYADYRIRGAMIDALRSVDEMSRHRREQSRDLDELVTSLSRQLRREPTVLEIANELGVTIEQYHRLRKNIAPVSQISIDATIDDSNEDGRKLLDTIADEATVDPLTVVLKQELRHEIRQSIAQLSEKKRQCILLYYGRNMNLSEIAEVFDLTPSRISQILSTARQELRGVLRHIAISNGYFSEDQE